MSAQRDSSVFVTTPQLELVLPVLLPTVALRAAQCSSWASTSASALYIAGFMVVAGQVRLAQERLDRSDHRCVLTFLMFEVWFKVPLFKGSLNPLSLGY